MEGNKGFIDIQRAFACQACKKVALQPFVSQCCEVIMCQMCVRRGSYCPKCRTYDKGIKQSPLLLSLLEHVTSVCPYGCKQQIPLNQLQKHSEICPEATTECIYCKQIIKIGMLPEHISIKHVEECNRLLNEFHKDPGLKIQGKPEMKIKTTIQPFKVGTTGTPNIDPRLSSVGRIICGRTLSKDHSMNQSIGIFGKKSEQVCSVDNGSCEKCMELDIKRLGLPRRHLLNFQGRICCFSPELKRTFCGISAGQKKCSAELQCHPCKQLLDMIKRGFYEKFIK